LKSLAAQSQINMNAEQKVSWLNEYGSLRKWTVGDDVRCRGCGGVFKAERAASDSVGEPTCPHCIGSTPAEFEKVSPGRQR
jgi:hypothetical protein